MTHRHTVMVDDNDAAAFFVDFLAFKQALLVGVHHDEQRVGCDDIQRLIRGNKIMPLTCIDHGFKQRPCQRGLAVDGNDRRDAAHLADAQRTDGRADRVQIGHAVAHDDHAVAAADQVAQCIGYDAAADMAAFLHAVGNAAVKFKAIHRFDSRLITAAAEGDVNALPRHLVTLLQRFAAVANTDGKSCKPAGMQRAHPVQNVEPPLQHPADIAFLDHRNVAAV